MILETIIAQIAFVKDLITLTSDNLKKKKKQKNCCNFSEFLIDY